MTQNAETPRVVTGAFQEDSAAGGKSAAIVEQVRRRREAAERCEPLDCGHQDPHDCDAAGCGQDDRNTDPVIAPEVEPGDIAALWANAKTAWVARDFPKYGSAAWIALHPDDPRRLAGALEAAEMWRKFGDEEELIAWLKNLGRTPNLVGHRTRAEMDALAKPKPPHQLQATPGWPPIRVPGKPGRYLNPHMEAA
ncbi:hypothetical protein [Streptomyces sp. NPDC090057]|uniref:hypothetical protein n=1 Tax=Streptomyces sp. NPDC090057 TaxID=3365935 RepID=UPI00382DB9DE